MSAPPVNAPSAAGAIAGIFYWTWSSTASLPSGTNLGVAFSGWNDVTQALSESSAVLNKLPGTRYLDIGGGAASGRWTSAILSQLTSAIKQGSLSAYAGICYDIEEGDAGLLSLFKASFAAAKAKGLKVLVTVSYSQPYGFSDGFSLMTAFLASSNIDIISPQLYQSGKETSNDFRISAGSGTIQWSSFKGAKALIVPAIVSKCFYPDAVKQFAAYGVTLGGYIQWTQSAVKC